MIQGDQVWCDGCGWQMEIPEEHQGDIYHWLATQHWTIEVDEIFCPMCSEVTKK